MPPPPSLSAGFAAQSTHREALADTGPGAQPVSGEVLSPSGGPIVMWLRLRSLSDGVRVEVGYATSDDAAAALGANIYRVRTPDGQTREFSSTIELLEHLDARYCLDEIEHAVTPNCGWPGRSTVRRA